MNLVLKKYQLKLSTEANNPLLRVGDVSTRFFFRKGDDVCYNLDAHIDFMLSNCITEMDLWLAERVTNSPYYYCKKFGEVGEKSEGGCGKLCKGYEARNGKSGACKYNGYTYEQTEICFTLKWTDELVFQNEC